MAQTFRFDLKNFERRLDIYEQSQANFAGKVALTKLAKRLKSPQGLAQRYKRIFLNPVPFTLNSTFTMQRGLELDVGIKDRIAKGNPAGKYLFPPIGVGSGRAYDTQFTQYLRNRDLINSGDYPFAATDNPLVRTNKYGNVTSGTYGSTKRALGKTRGAKGTTGFVGGNSKIGDARVIAFKNDKTIKRKDGSSKTLRRGIYREGTKGGLLALFYYGDIPKQKKGGVNQKSKMIGRLFPEIVKNFTDAQLFKIWLREIKNLAK